MVKNQHHTIPRTIWFLWLQGLDNAPMLVKKCYASWKRHNPKWNVVLLDEKNIGKYLDIRGLGIVNEGIIKQAFSDLVRINLLAQFGGVWVDATCFCQVSLDAWLDKYTKSGFFAFYKPARDRWIASWFLASAPNCHLVLKWCDESNKYWRNNSFSIHGSHLINGRYITEGRYNGGILWLTYHLINMILTRTINRDTNATKIWFSYFVRKIIKVYPYFWFHYLFDRVIQEDAKCMQIWAETKKYGAYIPHKLLINGLFRPLSEEIRQHIDDKQSPVYKLTWKYIDSKYKEGCALHYLLESAPR
jgi:hypothetical protein